MACKTAVWLQQQDDADRIAFSLWTRSAKELHDHCKTAGFPGGLTSTKEHFRGRCGCAQS